MDLINIPKAPAAYTESSEVTKRSAASPIKWDHEFKKDVSTNCYTFNAFVVRETEIKRPAQEFENLTDYLLDRDSTDLIPDIYYQFLQNFSGISRVYAVYCLRDLDDFKAGIDGTELEVNCVAALVISRFHSAFKTILGPYFTEDFRGSFFSKECVENEFFPKVFEPPKGGAYGLRKNAVVGKALGGDVKPLVWFLKGFGYCERSIWAEVFPLLMRRNYTKFELRKFLKILREYMNKKDGHILTNLREFIETLEYKKLYQKRNTRPDSHSNGNSNATKVDGKRDRPFDQVGNQQKIQKTSAGKNTSKKSCQSNTANIDGFSLSVVEEIPLGNDSI